MGSRRRAGRLDVAQRTTDHEEKRNRKSEKRKEQPYSYRGKSTGGLTTRIARYLGNSRSNIV